MPTNPYHVEEILHTVRETGVLIAHSRTVTKTYRQLGITDHIDCRWRKDYRGMNLDQAKRLREREAENPRPTVDAPTFTPRNTDCNLTKTKPSEKKP